MQIPVFTITKANYTTYLASTWMTILLLPYILHILMIFSFVFSVISKLLEAIWNTSWAFILRRIMLMDQFLFIKLAILRILLNDLDSRMLIQFLHEQTLMRNSVTMLILLIHQYKYLIRRLLDV